MKTTLTLSLALLATVSSAPLASASILASDDFNSYTSATALTGGSGGTGWGANAWLAPSTNTTLATVNDYSGDKKVDMTLSGTASSVVAGRQLGAGISQTFYASYLVRYNGSDVGNNNTFGLILSDLTTPNVTVNSTNIINFGIRGTTGNTNEFGIRAGTATAGSTVAQAVVNGQDYFLVAKLNYSGGFFTSGDLWINPNSGFETTPDATINLNLGAGVGIINSVYFRQAANQQPDDTYRFDNLVLATTWAEVVPVPEPSTLTLAGMGIAALLAFRRRGQRRA